MNSKLERHKKICENLNAIYQVKNRDYGDSFGETYRKLGLISAVTRITDKCNRIQSLARMADQQGDVLDESIDDTLLDMANYCIMTYIEREIENEEEIKGG